MGVRFDVDTTGMAEEIARIDDMRRRAEDLTPVLTGRAQAGEGVIQEQVFDRGQSPLGDPWAGLAASTLKKRRGRSAQILVNTGKLREGIQGIAKPHSVVFSSDKDFGAYLQTGTRHMPARPFIPTGFDRGPIRDWADRVDDRVRRYIETGEV